MQARPAQTLFKDPSILDFAQMSLDVYGSKQDTFSNLWFRINEWPRKEDRTHIISSLKAAPRTVSSEKDYEESTGFYAALYRHIITGVGIVAIRGN